MKSDGGRPLGSTIKKGPERPFFNEHRAEARCVRDAQMLLSPDAGEGAGARSA